MYCWPTAKEMYQSTRCFDPEGLLGNLTSIYLTYLGLQAGKVFSMYPNFKDKKHMKGIVSHLVVGILFYGIIGNFLGISTNTSKIYRVSPSHDWIRVRKRGADIKTHRTN